VRSAATAPTANGGHIGGYSRGWLTTPCDQHRNLLWLAVPPNSASAMGRWFCNWWCPAAISLA
jgi:hypothetical protein